MLELQSLKARMALNNIRAKDMGAEGIFTLDEWLEILEGTQGVCYYCHEQVGNDNLVIEHQIPLAKNGLNAKENIVAACNPCNWSKGDRTPEEWTPEKRLQPKQKTVAASLVISMKVWTQTLRNLKILAAYQSKSMLNILDRLVKEELEREEEKTRGKIMSKLTKEATMNVVVLSEQAPQGNPSANARWGGSTDGTEMVTWLKEGQWYGCLQGIYQGNWFEGEDQGPFETREEAEAYLREDYAESQQPQPDIYPSEDE